MACHATVVERAPPTKIAFVDVSNSRPLGCASSSGIDTGALKWRSSADSAIASSRVRRAASADESAGPDAAALHVFRQSASSRLPALDPFFLNQPNNPIRDRFLPLPPGRECAAGPGRVSPATAQVS